MSTEPDAWLAAEVLRDDFVHSQSILDEAQNAAELEDQTQQDVHLLARFLGFTVESIAKSEGAGRKARLAVLSKALEYWKNVDAETGAKIEEAVKAGAGDDIPGA